MAKAWSYITKGIVSSFLPQNLDVKQKAIVSFRYLSWLIMSIYYFCEPPYDNLKLKIIVISILLISSCFLMDRYLKSKSTLGIQITIVVEKLGLIILIISTGGLESPFIWYAFITVFITSNYLKAIYNYLYLILYLLTAIIASSIFYKAANPNMLQILHNKAYIIAVYVQIQVAMILQSRLINQLDLQAQTLKRQRQQLVEMNDKLNDANSNVKRSMDYLMSLYQIIESISLRGEISGILKQLLESTVDIMGDKATFLWVNLDKDTPEDFMTHNFPSEEVCQFQTYVEKEVFSYSDKNRFELNYRDTSFEVISVRSTARKYGFIGVEIKKGDNLGLDLLKLKLLIFLADLIAVILEREYFERISSKLLILDEQNRISNEIHDNVSQRLFSILCAIHTLNVKRRTMDESDVGKQLQLIEQFAKEASQELRASIYRLSSSKQEESAFKQSIMSYLQDFANLNNVTVNFDFHGEEEIVSYKLKQALYRIIREAIGNAVRHGKSSEMLVKISVDPKNLELSIKDNGQGFDSVFALENQKNNGLGLKNMLLLTQAFGGSFNISSTIGTGCEIEVLIPLTTSQELKAKKEGVA
ncbi:sensor histidine kinase [Desulfosporosinus sp. SYSU MS00001]|uniref:sensor histidine kinase n=1 Tax=Desulfosporosinus sp. SYSU MS00001 TaxID=3416284 RepID=UPI003CEF3885